MTTHDTTVASPAAPGSAAPRPAGTGPTRERVGARILRLTPYSTLIVWLLAIVAFSLLSPDVFFTATNLRAVLNEQAVLVIVACGLVVPLICGQFDLSIGATISFAGLITAGLMSHSGLPPAPAVLAGLGIGLAVGAVNGYLTAYAGVNSFIASLGVATILSGFTLWYGRGQIVFEGIPRSFVELGQGDVAGIQLPVLYALGTAVLVWFMLSQTPLGRYLYAIGGNRTAADVAGVPSRRYILYILMASGVFAALAGIVLTARSASAQTGAGDTFLLPAFAVCFIGASTFRRGQFNVPGLVVGVYLLATLVNGAFVLGARDYVSPLIQGIALILAVVGNRALVKLNSA
jgi:ribose transport system permease protein